MNINKQIMEKPEIAKKLELIIGKIQANNISAWEDDLEDTKEVVMLEDFKKGDEVFTYNNWLEDLQELVKELKK